MFFELLGFGLISASIKTARAAEPTVFTPQVGIPNSPFTQGEKYTFDKKSTQPIADYVRAIYKYAIGVVGILATVVMMIGGVMWIMSGGSPERAGEAKAWITASISGLVLTLCSYLILATVNPALVNFKITAVADVSEIKIGCCDSSFLNAAVEQENRCKMVSKDECADGSWKGEGLICSSSGSCITPPTTCCAFDYAVGVGYRGCRNGFENQNACNNSLSWTVTGFGIDFQENKQCKVTGRTGALGAYRDLYGCE